MHGSYPVGIHGLGGFGGEEIGSIGAVPFVYVPDLAPVGHADSYFPRSVEQDAAALNFLGFLANVDDANRASSTGSQRGDMNDEAGAWDPNFRAAIASFQDSRGLTVDSWVGPQTRTALLAAVTAANAKGLGGGFVPPIPPPAVPLPVVPGNVPVKPGATPPPGTTEEDNTLMYVAIGVAVLAAGGLGWWVLSK